MAFKKTTLLAGLFGNTVEWYDFILYANFSAIIAKLFFPTHDYFTSLLITFAVFAIGFFARPIGALILGYIGDKLGRKTALLTSMISMTIPTIAIAFLPTFATAGLFAPIALTLVRLVQGLAVGGELNSAATFLIEHAPKNRRGLAGCLTMTTAFIGILLGALVSFITTATLSNEMLLNWGWRVPFLFGGIMGIAGIIIRLGTEESPFYQQELTENHTPLKNLFSQYRKKIILGVLLTCCMAVTNYLIIAYVVTYLAAHEGFTLKQAQAIHLIALTSMVFLCPIMGFLSDKVGRKPIIKAGFAGVIILTLPIFWLLASQHFTLALIGDLLLCLVTAPIAALIPTILAELFPTQIRNSGSAFSYNISLALFGGTTPLIALEMVKFFNSDLAPAFYLIACAIVSIIALLFVSESRDQDLH